MCGEHACTNSTVDTATLLLSQLERAAPRHDGAHAKYSNREPSSQCRFRPEAPRYVIDHVGNTTRRWYRVEISGLCVVARQKHGRSREIVRGIVPSSRCHPDVRRVTPHRSFRLAFKRLIVCFSASQGASSLAIRAGSWPRDAVHLTSERSSVRFPTCRVGVGCRYPDGM